MLLSPKFHSYSKKAKETPDTPQLHNYQSCRSTLTHQTSLSPSTKAFTRTTIGSYSSVNCSIKKSPFYETPTIKNLSDHISITLSYREKLNNMENLIHTCKDYAKQFGYFYITQPLFFYDPITCHVKCWIHPDRRINKPLHPILKLPGNETKRIFYRELKRVLRKIFNTIPQPLGSNYLNLIMYIRKLRKAVEKRISEKSPLKNPPQIKSYWQKKEKYNENQKKKSPNFIQNKQTLRLRQKSSLKVSQQFKKSEQIYVQEENQGKQIVKPPKLEISEIIGQEEKISFHKQLDEFSMAASFTNHKNNPPHTSALIQSLSAPFSSTSSHLKDLALKTLNKLKKSTDDKVTSQIIDEFDEVLTNTDLEKDQQIFSSIVKDLECLLFT